MGKKQRGATIIEIITVITVFSTLFGIITISLLTSRAKASFQGTLSVLVSDIQAQQVKAISFDTQNSPTTDTYGIYFTQSSYTLFKGATYESLDPNNFVVTFADDIQFSNISLPYSSVKFLRNSGEISGFDPNLHTLTLINTQTNEQKTININRYGVITSAN